MMSEENTYILPWEDFRLVRRIGAGGYGEVWEAVRKVSETTEEHSAIKIITIPESQAQLDQIKRNVSGFGDSTESVIRQVVDDCIHEIEVMVSLKHASAHIVTLEDYKIVHEYDPELKTEKYQIFIREELLKPVHEFSPTGMLNEQAVIQMGIDICEALSVLEKKQYVHRDVTSSNILVSTEGGQVAYKLSDFGIAKHLENLNSFLSRRGKSFFMPPELIAREGNGKTVDTYGLGMTMYWYLNGNRFPFVVKRQIPLMKDFENAEYIRVNNEKDIPAPENTSDALAQIVLKAIAYNPDNRYQSAAEMLADLLSLKSSISNVEIYDQSETELSYKTKATFITADSPKHKSVSVNSFDDNPSTQDTGALQRFRKLIIPSWKVIENTECMIFICGLMACLGSVFVYNSVTGQLFDVNWLVSSHLVMGFCYLVMNYVMNNYKQYPKNPNVVLILLLTVLAINMAAAAYPAVDGFNMSIRVQIPLVNETLSITPSIYAEIMTIVLFAFYHRSSKPAAFGGQNTYICLACVLPVILVNVLITKCYLPAVIILIISIICLYILNSPTGIIMMGLLLPYLWIKMPDITLIQFQKIVYLINTFSSKTTLLKIELIIKILYYFFPRGGIIVESIQLAKARELNQFQKISVYGSVTFIICQTISTVYMMINHPLINICIGDVVGLAIVCGIIQSALAEAN